MFIRKSFISLVRAVALAFIVVIFISVVPVFDAQAAPKEPWDPYEDLDAPENGENAPPRAAQKITDC
jgi:hypothetical protein